MKDKIKTDFNFKQPILGIKYLEDFMQEIDFFRRKNLKADQDKKKSYKPLVLTIWMLITLLSAGVIGLSYFAYVQYKENQYLIAENQKKKSRVAGVNESWDLNVISGENFSIVLNQETPKGFILLSETKNWPFSKDQKSTISSFFYQTKLEDKNLFSGIKINSLEYDNKYDRESFDQLVLEKLGKDWEIKSRDINIPNNIKLSKLQNNNGKSYYVTVTSSYYYLIEIENQTSSYPEFKEVSQFVDKFLANLYLN